MMSLGWLIVLIQVHSKLYWLYYKKYETLPTNPPIYICIDRIINSLVFKIKDGHMLELQTPEIMKLFASIKNWRNKTNNGENVSILEVTEGFLIQFGLVDNLY